MYERLKEILMDKHYPSSRYFEFPRRSGTTTMLLALAQDMCSKGKVCLIVNNYFWANELSEKSKSYPNLTIISAGNSDKLRGLKFDYYILDTCLDNINLETWEMIYPTNSWISVSTV